MFHITIFYIEGYCLLLTNKLRKQESLNVRSGHCMVEFMNCLILCGVSISQKIGDLFFLSEQLLKHLTRL